MTIQMCISICREKNFSYAGLQWQFECFCGEEPADGFKWSWSEKCSDRCAGDSNQICGGTNAISIWRVPPKTLNGICVHNSPTNKGMLDDYSIIGHENLTIQKCQQICSGMKIISF